MMNMLRFKQQADYSMTPELAPATPISGEEAFQKYIDHTLPFLNNSGGDFVFLGKGGPFFIGPEYEHWDLIMIVKQSSLESFLSFAILIWNRAQNSSPYGLSIITSYRI